jgi:exonuclease VII small subunit
MEIAVAEVSTVVRQITDGEFTLEAALVLVEDIMQRQAAGQI